MADESHYLKSVDAKRSQAIVPLMQKSGELLQTSRLTIVDNSVRVYYHIMLLLDVLVMRLIVYFCADLVSANIACRLPLDL